MQPDVMPVQRQLLLLSLLGAAIIVMLALAPAADAMLHRRKPRAPALHPEPQRASGRPKVDTPTRTAASLSAKDGSTMRCAGSQRVDRACLLHDLFYDTRRRTFTYYGTAIVNDTGAAPVDAGVRTFADATCGPPCLRKDA